MKKILSMFLMLFVVIALTACAPSENDPPKDSSTAPVEDPNNDDISENEELDNNDKDEEKDQEVEEYEDKDEQEEQEIEEEDVDPDPDVDEDKGDEEEIKKEQEVNLYFANLEYIETGDESLDQVKTEKRIINYEGSTLEEAVVKEIFIGPKDDDLTSPIPDTIKLLGVEVKDKIAYVDFSSEGLEGSSLQESLTIDQILKSLFDLDTIEKIHFLVDGEQAESLMGHVSIDKAFEDTSE